VRTSSAERCVPGQATASVRFRRDARWRRQARVTGLPGAGTGRRRLGGGEAGRNLRIRLAPSMRAALEQIAAAAEATELYGRLNCGLAMVRRPVDCLTY